MTTDTTKVNETKQNKAGQNGTKPDKDDQVNGRFPFSTTEVYAWLQKCIKEDYGTIIEISDLTKTRGIDDMIDIVGKMVKK